ncbi:hypothetical protein [Melittangium boletus]|uniref:Lipoprotein n=1 Tax=Melittangium boletus DSM 14713 TaxID=1294270 RepID=A0A250IGG7_9BACT|nr:hypothetical protein [Melittangium boletus]ATB30358.1 hypothetical protein MEBOL_003819 [Melittangium boletus DSM 14713]
MRSWFAAVVLVAVTGLAGCGPSRDDCESEVLDPQGETYRCIASEDCPRSANETLCITDTGSDVECIRCLDTWCLRVTPAEDCS